MTKSRNKTKRFILIKIYIRVGGEQRCMHQLSSMVFDRICSWAGIMALLRAFTLSTIIIITITTYRLANQSNIRWRASLFTAYSCKNNNNNNNKSTIECTYIFSKYVVQRYDHKLHSFKNMHNIDDLDSLVCDWIMATRMCISNFLCYFSIWVCTVNMWGFE